MNPDYARMLATAGHGYAAWFAATMEVGERALRATAAECGSAATLAAATLPAPASCRGAATEDAIYSAHQAQHRLLRGIGGLPTLWGMSFLHHFDRARRRQPPF